VVSNILLLGPKLSAKEVVTPNMVLLYGYKSETRFHLFPSPKKRLLIYVLGISPDVTFPSNSLMLAEGYTQGMTLGFAWVEMFFGKIL
jgi:hypothetical protein